MSCIEGIIGLICSHNYCIDYINDYKDEEIIIWGRCRNVIVGRR